MRDELWRLRFEGVNRLYGGGAVARLAASHVVVVGLGGVGSWTVEALARSGVGSLSLVDLDEVCISNTNRQLHALAHTVGVSKGVALAERVGLINPDCHVRVREEWLTVEGATDLIQEEACRATHIFRAISREYARPTIALPVCKGVCKGPVEAQTEALASWSDALLGRLPTSDAWLDPWFSSLRNLEGVSCDHSFFSPPNFAVVDAIDGYADKAALLSACARRRVRAVSVGAAGGLRDPTMIRAADLTAAGDGLLRRTRTEMRRRHGFPPGAPRQNTEWGIRTIFSVENGQAGAKQKNAKRTNANMEAGRTDCDRFGTACFATGAVGFAAAAEVVTPLATAAAPLTPIESLSLSEPLYDPIQTDGLGAQAAPVPSENRKAFDEVGASEILGNKDDPGASRPTQGGGRGSDPIMCATYSVELDLQKHLWEGRQLAVSKDAGCTLSAALRRRGNGLFDSTRPRDTEHLYIKQHRLMPIGRSLQLLSTRIKPSKLLRSNLQMVSSVKVMPRVACASMLANQQTEHRARMLMAIFDSHSHALSDVRELIASGKLRGLCVVSTGEEEWPIARALVNSRRAGGLAAQGPQARRDRSVGRDINHSAIEQGNHIACASHGLEPRLVVALGVHPWWLHKQTVGWGRRLGEVLQETPGALVGECGLDRSRRARAPLEAQLIALKNQLQLAGDLGRPVILHCVRAHGHLLSLLSSGEVAPLPPSIVMHAYGGSPETAAGLLRLEDSPDGPHVYFGFSPPATRLKHAAATIKAVPADRLLIESDLHDGREAIAAATDACHAVAAMRGWSAEETARITTSNAACALECR